MATVAMIAPRGFTGSLQMARSTPPSSGLTYTPDANGFIACDVRDTDAAQAAGFTYATGGLPPVKFTAAALSAGTLAAGLIAGAAKKCVLQCNVGATPGTQTTRTAAQMLADVPGAQVGDVYEFRIVNNTAAAVLTLAGDASVTTTGTMTVAALSFRDFILTFLSATTANITSLGVSGAGGP